MESGGKLLDMGCVLVGMAELSMPTASLSPRTSMPSFKDL
jgi:hypothetical protein